MTDSKNSDTSIEALNKSYTEQRNSLLGNLKKLPPTEMHYYFALLVASIENESNREQYTQLIIKANEVIKQLNHYYDLINEGKKPDLTELTNALNQFIICSKMRSAPHTVKMAALSVCSVVLGFITGVVGAIAGFLGGLFSDYTITGNLRASGLGFVTGLALGIKVGSGCPNMIFQSAFERKLEYCIDSIHRIGKELPTKKSYKEYVAETKKYILDVFYKDTPDSEKDAAFERFLNDDKQQFQVSTTTAGFISKKLKGYLGHHFLIHYSINGKYHTPMEYGDRKEIKNQEKAKNKFFDQNELPRPVTGKKLFDMLVLDRILQETHHYSLQNYFLRGGFLKFDMGSNDCRTYVDKLLIGTNQAPTQIPRFNSQNDKWIGTHIVGPIVRFFSKTKETELKCLIPHYKKENQADPVIEARKWTGKEALSIKNQEEVLVVNTCS